MVALRDTYKMPWPLVLLGLAHAEEKKAQADALALLQLVGLESQALTRAKDLTYGAQRFLEIARALARKPRLLILDEPAAGLAHPDAHNLVEIIRRVHTAAASPSSSSNTTWTSSPRCATPSPSSTAVT